MTKGNHPLVLRNVTFKSKTETYQAATCSFQQLWEADEYCTITFDNQKNRTKGETVAHYQMGHSIACPVEVMKHLIAQLRQHKAGLDTPICTYYKGKVATVIKSTSLTSMLRAAVRKLLDLGYDIKDVSARSLRAGGTMVLLLAGVDKDPIKLVGRWRSDAIFQYLHAQALPLVKPLASKMLEHGVYTLIPGGITPEQVTRMLAQVPPEPGQPYFLEISPEEEDNDIEATD